MGPKSEKILGLYCVARNVFAREIEMHLHMKGGRLERRASWAWSTMNWACKTVGTLGYERGLMSWSKSMPSCDLTS
jgi:hypothetical protein